MTHRFTQLDVFTDVPFKGNPLAVVHAADDLDSAQMQAIACWLNLSETTFLLEPEDEQADYRVRIFTPQRELPFAGHPTLGTCRAWLAAGGRPRAGAGGEIVQGCGVGPVRIRRFGDRLAFAAPPQQRSGPADSAVLDRIALSLRINPAVIRAAQWVDNGPGWLAVLLGSRDEVLALRPDYAEMGDMRLGVVAPWDGGDAEFEVRAFIPSGGGWEDPVTGSLNAGVAQWLIGAGIAPPRYVASQGTVLGRRGRVHVNADGDDIWIGGDTVICIEGQLHVPRQG